MGGGGAARARRGGGEGEWSPPPVPWALGSLRRGRRSPAEGGTCAGSGGQWRRRAGGCPSPAGLDPAGAAAFSAPLPGQRLGEAAPPVAAGGEQRGRADAPPGSGLGGIGSRSAGPPFRLPWRLTERSGARSPWPVARGGLPAIRALRQARQPCQPRGEGGRGGRVAVCLAVCLLTRAGAQGVLSVQPKIA